MWHRPSSCIEWRDGCEEAGCLMDEWKERCEEEDKECEEGCEEWVRCGSNKKRVDWSTKSTSRPAPLLLAGLPLSTE